MLNLSKSTSCHSLVLFHFFIKRIEVDDNEDCEQLNEIMKQYLVLESLKKAILDLT